jgi:hypothetical protein
VTGEVELALPRRRFHRMTFLAAGIYNLAWGLHSALDPQWLFRFAGMEPMRHPEVFACLAMVVGIYGLLYLEVARRPESGGAIAAVGLLGKLLGPAGLAVLILQGRWPVETLVLVATNDLVWWLPFGLYLADLRRAGRAARLR